MKSMKDARSTRSCGKYSISECGLPRTDRFVRIVALLLAVATLSATACGREIGGDGRTDQPTARELRACAVDAPGAWLDAIGGSAIDTGGVTTSPRAVGPDGDVVAVRDSGETQDLLLIDTDRSVRELYALTEPAMFAIGDVGLDDRWIVFAIDRHPRNANGVLPQMKRIELIDRQTGARSTVTEQSDADAAAKPDRNVLDRFVLSDGKVYWITRDEYNSEAGVVHSFDPLTGRGTDIASGPISDLLAGTDWPKVPVKVPPTLTVLSAEALASLGTDGVAFGWTNPLAGGGTEVGYWSPQTGRVTVVGVDVDVTKFRLPVLVFDSFVILNSGGSTTMLGSSATIVDTRSGAVAELIPRVPGQYDRAVASMGGTLALALWARAVDGFKQADYAAGMLRTGALAALAC